ncbi:MAG TPA: type II toxin-antitoxin system prevent-host-death family antitoxin [Pseudomonas sp.]|nr:type II toxin-antitoxin system prevent-host-death family antitoxin [Pseudomonas sp.]
MNRDIFSELVEGFDALAAERQGNVTLLTHKVKRSKPKHGRALPRLVPVGKPCGQRIGAMKGKLVLPEDFDAPLPDDMLDAFEGTQE